MFKCCPDLIGSLISVVRNELCLDTEVFAGADNVAIDAISIFSIFFLAVLHHAVGALGRCVAVAIGARMGLHVEVILVSLEDIDGGTVGFATLLVHAAFGASLDQVEARDAATFNLTHIGVHFDASANEPWFVD